MPNKKTLIVLYILLTAGLAVRLYKIDNPIADWHSWRQADTSAVTRNYIKYGIDLFRPRYDDYSDVSGKGLFNPQGYRFVEFPIFNLLHFTLVKIFPFNTLEFWGRMTSVLAGLISSVLLYLIVKRRTSVNTGLLAAFFYLFLPYNIFYTRVVLPDPLMITFVLSGIYFHDRWFADNRKKDLIFGIIFSSLAVLVKPVAMFFLFPIFWQQLIKFRLKILKTPSFWISAIGMVLPFAIWRIWESRFPQGIPANLWLLNGNGIRFKGAFFRWIFGERVGNLILGNWGIFPLISGLISPVSGFLPWVFGALVYLFTFATGNVQHDYYQIAIIPIISILLALGVSSLWKSDSKLSLTLLRRSLVIVSLGFMFSFSWYQIRGYYQINHWEIVKAGQAVDRLAPKDAIVAAPYLGDTAFLYQTNRPGFPFMTMPVKDMIDKYNVTYYVSVNYDDETNAIMRKYTVVEKTPEYVIVKLDEPVRP